MKYIQGQNRSQTYLFPLTLDNAISADNEVRLIDVFVDSLALKSFGFQIDQGENGRPAYHPGDLLKLFIYGYMNKIRSSRRLEKESKRNIEVMWLLGSLHPDHNTISNFRRDNPKAIKKVFRETVKIANYFNLIGGTLIAGDSTKLRAQNSKKNNFNQKKISRHLAYIENKLQEYNEALAQSDGDSKEHIEVQIEKHKQRAEGYREIENQLKESGESQVSTSDPDSRQMIIRNNITEVAYNIQTTVDAKNNLLIDYKVTNCNDVKAMGNMLQRAKSILGTNEFTALYDKGYHTGSEFKMAHDLKIDTLVAIPRQTFQAPDPDYNAENFTYIPDGDYYLCPQNQPLTTTGKWYKAEAYSFKRYTIKACKSCSAKDLCTKSIRGKGIHRSEFHEYIQHNKERVELNKPLYKRRQAIVEHPYGTIKRQWGFSYIMTKKNSKRASADVGFMMTAYNLRRIINILGMEWLREYLQDRIDLFFSKTAVLDRILAHMLAYLGKMEYWNPKEILPVNRLSLIHITSLSRSF
ncbi:MAG: IS1182 family transposase [Gammaproteobacteria bacterium]|nr:MAG: IS1182 family transposase [Gammaproteobacteria bacterium]